MNEVWKSVKGYEGIYEVSNTGLVKSLSRPRYCGRAGYKPRITKEQLKVANIDRLGYPRISLSKDGKTKKGYLHRLVAEAFLKPTDEKNEVNHKDGNKANNNVDNLEWCSRRENMLHSFRTGLKTAKKGQENVTAKLKTTQVSEIKKHAREGTMSQREMAETYKVTIATINYIVNGKTWKDVI